NHSLRFSSRYKLNDGILGGTWTKTSKEGGQNFSAGDTNTLGFKMLNDTTAYLRLPSFSPSNRAKIDSLYELADAKIRQTPYLIVDVRDNGGGSDDNANPLLPYIYTNPIQGDRVELLVTEDNLNLWRDALKNAENDPRNYGKGDVAWFRREVKKMEKAKPNTFILRSKAGKRKIKDISEFPKSVAIIQNQNCASSCETLLFWAKQSEKTILVGENSGGYVGYGENFGLYTPCYQYRLTCTMTRYKEQRKYEAEGIAPDYQLEYTSDWITQTLEILGEEK
ncbi:MAG: S41 family peptidase, partial [Bacteroidota bacterium]